MLSRVAESIYWMSRYIERAENVARFCRCQLASYARHADWHANAVGTACCNNRRR